MYKKSNLQFLMVKKKYKKKNVKLNQTFQKKKEYTNKWHFQQKKLDQIKVYVITTTEKNYK